MTSRDEKSLGRITTECIRILHRYRERGEMKVSELELKLNAAGIPVTRRRLSDVVNVLEGIGFISRTATSSRAYSVRLQVDAMQHLHKSKPQSLTSTSTGSSSTASTSADAAATSEPELEDESLRNTSEDLRKLVRQERELQTTVQTLEHSVRHLRAQAMTLSVSELRASFPDSGPLFLVPKRPKVQLCAYKDTQHTVIPPSATSPLHAEPLPPAMSGTSPHRAFPSITSTHQAASASPGSASESTFLQLVSTDNPGSGKRALGAYPARARRTESASQRPIQYRLQLRSSHTFPIATITSTECHSSLPSPAPLARDPQFQLKPGQEHTPEATSLELLSRKRLFDTNTQRTSGAPDIACAESTCFASPLARSHCTASSTTVPSTSHTSRLYNELGLYELSPEQPEVTTDDSPSRIPSLSADAPQAPKASSATQYVFRQQDSSPSPPPSKRAAHATTTTNATTKNGLLPTPFVQQRACPVPRNLVKEQLDKDAEVIGACRDKPAHPTLSFHQNLSVPHKSQHVTTQDTHKHPAFSLHRPEHRLLSLECPPSDVHYSFTMTESETVFDLFE
eukprot:m.204257 g.204257  ORF g.204257 m.204257 type:complete len:568 (-) comp15006_c0_seq14:3182-4885(-)